MCRHRGSRGAAEEEEEEEREEEEEEEEEEGKEEEEEVAARRSPPPGPGRRRSRGGCSRCRCSRRRRCRHATGFNDGEENTLAAQRSKRGSGVGAARTTPTTLRAMRPPHPWTPPQISEI
ncbi:tau-tubulin kinase 1-like isoform X3 [Grus americana]|uniref:tau-tubulin kinase 1-like isoform X3 n=1 Tax=Grus americana TaxID=9117 RepID=UPI0024081F34|nr:tau-tubulin kinase 1-like isoform X3 [Grus americana]